MKKIFVSLATLLLVLGVLILPVKAQTTSFYGSSFSINILKQLQEILLQLRIIVGDLTQIQNQSSSPAATSTVSTSTPTSTAQTAPTTTPAVKPSVTITSPLGGESWIKGSIYDIKWTVTGIDEVRIVLYKSSQFKDTLADRYTASLGEWRWYIAPSLKNSSDYSIRISDANDPFTIFSESSRFSLKR